MALNAKKIPNTNGPKADPVEPGSYPARTVQIIDLGLQPQRAFVTNGKSEEKKPAYEISVTYELVDEFMKDEDGEDILDKPRWISETFPFHSLQADRAKSTARYLALDPNMVYDGDWTQLLDTPCMVNVVQNAGKGKNAGKVYNNVASISSMRPKEANRLAPLVNEPKFVSLDEDDVEKFLSLPDFLQEKIKGGLEFEGTVLARALERHTGKNEKTPKEEADVAEKPKANKKREVVEDDDIPFDDGVDVNVDDAGENW